MTRTLQGAVRGPMIELDEDPGVADGQRVEVHLTVVPAPPTPPAWVSPGLAEIYALLGERFDSGAADTAARHDEHQP